MGGFLGDLTRMYLAPIVGMFFPDIIGISDAEDQHGFTVRYKPGEDLELAEHRDSSNATMNLCLGKPGFEASALYFRDGQTPKTREFQFKVGDAIFHKGNFDDNLFCDLSMLFYLCKTSHIHHIQIVCLHDQQIYVFSNSVSVYKKNCRYCIYMSFPHDQK